MKITVDRCERCPLLNFEYGQCMLVDIVYEEDDLTENDFPCNCPLLNGNIIIEREVD